ncbi:MAG: hypothetical protein ABR992_16945 [Solirubrobacteraceae bacterium]|jgi:hypothetical protein
MVDSSDDRIRDAAEEADRLAAEIGSAGGSLDPVYDQLDAFIAATELQGLDAEDLLPVSSESGIGFSLRGKRDGRTLWATIAQVGRDRLCDPSGEVAKLFARGSARPAATTVIGAVLVTLGLSMAAVPIAAAVAAFILAVGLQGFCEWSAVPVDEPGRA